MSTLEIILNLISQEYESDAAFEREMDLNPKTVDSWKRGRSKSYLNVIKDIATHFDVSTDYLLGRTEKSKKLPVQGKEITIDVYVERIKPLFESSGLTDIDLEKEIGLPKGTVYNWNIGRTKSYKKYADKISTYFNVSTDYLLGKSDQKNKPVFDADEWIKKNAIPIGNMVPIPVVGTIRAGVPILAEENIEYYELADVKDPGGYFFLRVSGDSMIGAGIVEGALVLIRKQNTAENGQIVACLVNGEEATLKRFKQQGNTVLLIAENAQYDPIVLSCDDFESGHAKILGVAKKVEINL